LVLGRATRLVRFLPASPKVYEGTLTLGVSTRTDDVAGEVVSRHAGALPGVENARVAAGRLCGEYRQRPPAFSARKVGGKRLYQLARQGRSVEVEPRLVRVGRFELDPADDDPGTLRFTAEVSSGTYVRSLVRDLGEELGCGAIVNTLRRTAIGTMRPCPQLRIGPDLLVDADLLREWLVAPEDMPLDPPPLRLGAADDAARFGAGTPLPSVPESVSDGTYRVVDGRGRLLGVADVARGVLRPRVVLGPRRA